MFHCWSPHLLHLMVSAQSDQVRMCSIGLTQEFGLRMNQLPEPEGVRTVALLHYKELQGFDMRWLA